MSGKSWIVVVVVVVAVLVAAMLALLGFMGKGGTPGVSGGPSAAPGAGSALASMPYQSAPQQATNTPETMDTPQATQAPSPTQPAVEGTRIGAFALAPGSLAKTTDGAPQGYTHFTLSASITNVTDSIVGAQFPNGQPPIPFYPMFATAHSSDGFVYGLGGGQAGGPGAVPVNPDPGAFVPPGWTVPITFQIDAPGDAPDLQLDLLVSGSSLYPVTDCSVGPCTVSVPFSSFSLGKPATSDHPGAQSLSQALGDGPVSVAVSAPAVAPDPTWNQCTFTATVKASSTYGYTATANNTFAEVIDAGGQIWGGFGSVQIDPIPPRGSADGSIAVNLGTDRNGCSTSLINRSGHIYLLLVVPGVYSQGQELSGPALAVFDLGKL